MSSFLSLVDKIQNNAGELGAPSNAGYVTPNSFLLVEMSEIN